MYIFFFPCHFACARVWAFKLAVSSPQILRLYSDAFDRSHTYQPRWMLSTKNMAAVDYTGRLPIDRQRWRCQLSKFLPVDVVGSKDEEPRAHKNVIPHTAQLPDPPPPGRGTIFFRFFVVHFCAGFVGFLPLHYVCLCMLVFTARIRAQRTLLQGNSCLISLGNLWCVSSAPEDDCYFL